MLTKSQTYYYLLHCTSFFWWTKESNKNERVVGFSFPSFPGSKRSILIGKRAPEGCFQADQLMERRFGVKRWGGPVWVFSGDWQEHSRRVGGDLSNCLVQPSQATG